MKKRYILLVLLVVIIGGLGAWNAVQPDATVKVIHASQGTLRAYVEEQAVTELPQDYLIAMPIAGRIQPIALREDDEVSVGQVVAELHKDDLADLEARVVQASKRVEVLETDMKKESDHTLEKNALVEAEATVKAIAETVQAAEKKLEAARAVTEFAHSEVERIRKILATDAAADRELRQAETEYRKAQAEYQSDALELAALKTLAAVSYIGPKFIHDYIDRKAFNLESLERQREEARATLEIEKRNLERARITSPVDGVVLDRHQTRSQFLAAGTPLLTIGRLDDIEVIAEVLTQRAAHIAVDDPVEIYGEAISDGPITGKVTRVYPAGFKKISSLGVEQQRVNVAIAMERRPPSLKVGYRVQVRIYYDRADDALILPRTALFRGEDGAWQVMVVENRETALRTVTVGLMNDQDAEIVDGLTEADQVVARPSREIVEGLHVEVAED